MEEYTTLSKECECEGPDLNDCENAKWTAANCIFANGLKRPVMTINRMIPGPSIQVCQDDIIRVNVKNKMKEPTSIHWHGMLQKGTPYMDGIPHITQCSIKPKESFIYQ